MIRTQMEAGPPKVRRRFTAGIRTMDMQLRLSADQVAMLDDYYATTLAVALEVVAASSPDTVEAGPLNMTLVTAEYDALLVTGELAFEDVLNEPFPGHSYIPSEYPGLF